MTNFRLFDQSPSVASGTAPRTKAAGEAPGLRELFEMHAAYVWNTLRRLGVHPSDLEDLTQDVFLHAQRRLTEYDPARPIRPWLFAFAYRIASQHRRRAYHRREIQGEPDAAEHPGAPPDALLEAWEGRTLVLRALDAIALERRAVFVLYEIDEVAMAEIAQTLGIPVNTAYSRLRLARQEFATAARRLRPEQRRR